MINSIFKPLNLLILIFIFSRCFSLFQEMPPFTFCDESIYLDATFKMLKNNSLYFDEFKSGGFNILPITFISNLFFPNQNILKIEDVLIVGRLFYLIIINSIGLIYLFKTAEIIYNKNIAYVSVIIYIFSPMVYSQQRYWYPDSYITTLSSIFLYYIIVLKNIKYTYPNNILIKLGVSFGFLISTKYTTILLIFQIFNLKKKRNINLLIFSASVIFIYILFNYSIITDADKFIKDILFHGKNYGVLKNGVYFIGIAYYIICIIALPLTWLLAPVVIYSFFLVERKYIYSFIVIPVFYISIIGGLAGIVFIRNLNLLLPYIIIVLANGIVNLFIKFKNSKFKVNLYVYILYLSIPILSTILAIHHDTKLDSRILARDWVKNNLPPHTTIGINDWCSGDSSANINENFLIFDPSQTNKSINYYVYNSYWAFPLSYKYKLSYWEMWDQKYFHFYQSSDTAAIIRTPSFFRLSSDDAIGYKIIKKFDSNGPDIYILEKINNN